MTYFLCTQRPCLSPLQEDLQRKQSAKQCPGPIRSAPKSVPGKRTVTLLPTRPWGFLHIRHTRFSGCSEPGLWTRQTGPLWTFISESNKSLVAPRRSAVPDTFVNNVFPFACDICFQVPPGPWANYSIHFFHSRDRFMFNLLSLLD